MNIRPAQHEDVDAIARIIGGRASQGLMLPRSHACLSAALPDYVVADLNGHMIGCGGLQEYAKDSAEDLWSGCHTGKCASGDGTGARAGPD
jgi:amino-acid N-acetyltransferase